MTKEKKLSVIEKELELYEKTLKICKCAYTN